MEQGRVVSIHIADQAAGPMKSVTEVRAVAGRGLEGDRYFLKRGDLFVQARARSRGDAH
jgi:hypothetical protein